MSREEYKNELIAIGELLVELVEKTSLATHVSIFSIKSESGKASINITSLENDCCSEIDYFKSEKGISDSDE